VLALDDEQETAKDHHASVPKKQQPLPLRIVENSNGTLSISFTTTKDELKTLLNSKQQAALLDSKQPAVLDSNQQASSAFSDLFDLPSSTIRMPETPVLAGTAGNHECTSVESTEFSDVTRQVLTRPVDLPARSLLASIPTYRRSPVDFSDLPIRNLDQQAFRDCSKSVGDGRVAKHQAVSKIVNAVKEAGTLDQQALALQGALVHPELREASKCAGYCPEAKLSADYQFKQARRLLKLARTTNNRRGPCSDAKDSLVQSFMTAVAPSPDSTLGVNGVPTRPQLMKSLGFEDF
jgi:hypothetical protein